MADVFGFCENDAQSSFGSSDFKRFPLKLVHHFGHAGCFCVAIENEATCTSLNLLDGVLVRRSLRNSSFKITCLVKLLLNLFCNITDVELLKFGKSNIVSDLC